MAHLGLIEPGDITARTVGGDAGPMLDGRWALCVLSSSSAAVARAGTHCDRADEVRCRTSNGFDQAAIGDGYAVRVIVLPVVELPTTATLAVDVLTSDGNHRSRSTTSRLQPRQAVGCRPALAALPLQWTDISVRVPVRQPVACAGMSSAQRSGCPAVGAVHPRPQSMIAVEASWSSAGVNSMP